MKESSTNEMQRTIEKLRKQLKSHTNITNDYRVKKQKAQGANPQGTAPIAGQEQQPVPGMTGNQPGQPGQAVVGQPITQTAVNQMQTPGMQQANIQGQQHLQQGMVMNRMPGQQQAIPVQMQQQNQGGMIQQPQQRMQMMPGQQPGMPQRMMISHQHLHHQQQHH